MCVIIHKPRGINVDEQVLALAHKGNVHGGGYVLSTPDGDVYFAKGFLNDETMVQFLNQMSLELGIATEDMEIIFHFRISTAGNINAMNCHPFVVDEKLIYKTQGKVENAWVLTHNGHHSFFPQEWGIDKDELKVYSDTFLLTRDFLALVKPKLRVNVLTHLASRGQKYAIMLPNGKVERYGAFKYDEDTKCYYSNMLWKPYTPSNVRFRSAGTATQTRLPWRGIDTDDSVYDDEFGTYVKDSDGVWREVTRKIERFTDYDFDIPSENCDHTVTYIDTGDGFVYCEDCGGNMTEYCQHPKIDDGGYCEVCFELVGVPSDDATVCDHPRVDSIEEDGVRYFICLDCGSTTKTERIVESVDSKESNNGI